jgi:hypothetical protein
VHEVFKRTLKSVGSGNTQNHANLFLDRVRQLRVFGTLTALPRSISPRKPTASVYERETALFTKSDPKMTLDSDAQEEADLEQAIKLSLESSKRKHVDVISSDEEVEVISKRPAVAPEAASSKPAFDRAQLERERLARQAARAAIPQPVASTSRIATSARPAASTSSRIRTFGDLNTGSNSSAPQASTSSSSSSSDSRPALPGRRFPTPTILSTWNRNFPDDPNSIKFSELRGDLRTLQSALMSALCADTEWVTPHFVQGRPLTIILNGDKDRVRLSKELSWVCD